MTFRTDRRARFWHLVHFRTPEIAAAVLVPAIIIVFWLTGSHSPIP